VKKLREDIEKGVQKRDETMYVWCRLITRRAEVTSWSA
jgi:hypothetical protein